ncbi:unnamed protein product (macronuclear) [Paramecium tetraurelia]|uniref:BZIP domain-containing protein n=1 Tax=Paramecium tetraurelia TaxID=5888 RepID=A0BDV0_PARTE|nr:uncharacterized protein GSPATT00027747001 [Paramecium tetraurelia]CAK56717.1 unnamed protein product [Paramecium tetraurelia]|eukprot:XP_001424115.1 hypothetical protein (macronuclear) [Paramecium tetraurelia strain d4-2]
MSNDQPFEDVDQFLHPLAAQQAIPNMLQQAITQDQLLAQNVRLLQQLHEQQRMLNLQSLFTNSMLMNPLIQQQVNQESKKIKKVNKTIKTIPSTTSLKDCAQPIQEIKGNVKNAYIKKITSLLSVEGDRLLDEDLQEDLDLESYSEMQDKSKLAGLLGSNNDLLNSESKNKRLRQSAKNSRLRKKVYLKLLEKKVSELDQQIQEYKKTTRQSFEYLTQILQSHPILNSMIIGNSAAIDQVLECSVPDQAQLVLDSYLMRYGTCGIKRRDYVKYAVKNIQKNFLKGNYGLQLMSWNQQIQNYDTEFNQYVEIVKDEAKLDDDNLVYRVLPTIDRMLNHRKMSQQYEQIQLQIITQIQLGHQKLKIELTRD